MIQKKPSEVKSLSDGTLATAFTGAFSEYMAAYPIVKKYGLDDMPSLVYDKAVSMLVRLPAAAAEALNAKASHGKIVALKKTDAERFEELCKTMHKHRLERKERRPDTHEMPTPPQPKPYTPPELTVPNIPWIEVARTLAQNNHAEAALWILKEKV